MAKKNRSAGSERRPSKAGEAGATEGETRPEVRGQVEVELSPGERYLILGCYNITIHGETAKSVTRIGGVPISPRFFGKPIPVYAFPECPAFEVANEGGSDPSRKGPKTPDRLKVTLTPLRRFSHGLFNPFVQPQTAKIGQTPHKFANESQYLSAAEAIRERIALWKKEKEFSLLVYGEKNVGKSTFCNYVLNYLVVNLPEEFEVRFCDLDIGKPTLDVMGRIGSRVVSSPLFVNCPNSLVSVQLNSGDVFEFIGENSPAIHPDSYIKKAEAILTSPPKPSGGATTRVTVVNYHGYMKGYGKIILQEIKKKLPGFVIKAKLKKEGQLVLKNSNMGQFFQTDLDLGGYRLLPPQFYQERRSLAIGRFLLENKFILELPVAECVFHVIRINKNETFFGEVNRHLLDLVFRGSVVSLRLAFANNTQRDFWGLFLQVDTAKDVVVINVPFLEAGSVGGGHITHAEVSKSTLLEFNVERLFNEYASKQPGSEPEPFVIPKIVGLGSKTLRKKVSKRK